MSGGRRLGQNFIVNPFYIARLLLLSDIKSDDIVLEIGTGYGELTKKLCEKANIVISYEIDKKLFKNSQKRLTKYNNLILINGDALKTNYMFNKVVSNLPFYISKRFIYWLITKSFTSATVTLQKDFVEKLIAQPSSKNYKAISVIAQLAFKINIYDKIPPTAFYPIPKVFSYIVKFEPKNQFVLNDSLIKIINFIFTFRGKKVRTMIKHLSKNNFYNVERECKNLNINVNVEHFTPQECLYIAKILLNQKLFS
ncbi:MAG: 16S rRNA (adenine(1518)-N(6)/adenine(1519)-N(6))-dimethyltransferase RsmA [Nitrososphaeria archaeon]|nr:16S rRNA (adenine(1518)-N(6)/adenine(1519)-N(6))-dimethyltransferase RsmA [Nitrososphaeria archaeon]